MGANGRIDSNEAYPMYPPPGTAAAINRESAEALAEYADEAILSPMTEETMDEYAAHLATEGAVDWAAERRKHLAQQRAEDARLGLTLVPKAVVA